jgi:hypothetical protein
MKKKKNPPDLTQWVKDFTSHRKLSSPFKGKLKIQSTLKIALSRPIYFASNLPHIENTITDSPLLPMSQQPPL